MSNQQWQFIEQPGCPLFTQWIAECPAGSKNTFSGTPGLEPVEGEPGIVRAKTVSALLEGKFSVAYLGWPDYEVEGFSMENGHTKTKQAGPQGFVATTAVKDSLWWCCHPRKDWALDYKQLEDGDEIRPRRRELFLVPVDNGVTINDTPVARFQIARAKGKAIRRIEGGRVIAIWKRKSQED